MPILDHRLNGRLTDGSSFTL